MSLITDTDYLIHSLRLSYLREIEDPYAARILNFSPAHQSNPYIHAANLADPERWPELAHPSSPNLSDEDERPLGGGARLKHTTTIMGGRSGGLGMRVRAKRHSTSKRMSTTPRTADVSKRHPTSKEQPPLPPIPDTESNPQIPKTTNTNTGVSVDKDLPKQPQLQVQEPTVAEDAPINLPKPIFKPNFNTAEMERRRRARMEMRGRFANPQPVGPPRPIIDSSDEEEPPPRKVEPEEVPEEMPEQTPEEEPEPTPTAASFDDEESSASDEFEIVGASVVHHDMEDADEFDPEFAANRTGGISDSASEVLSVFSNGTNSVSNSSSLLSPTRPGPRSRSQYSPERRRREPRQRSVDPVGFSFEMLTPALVSARAESNRQKPDISGAKAPTSPVSDSSQTRRSRTQQPDIASSTTTPTSTTTATTVPAQPGPDISFARKPVQPKKNQKSSLTAMLASSSSSNPFSEVYAAISAGRSGASTGSSLYPPSATSSTFSASANNSITIQVYFPHAKKPSGRPLALHIRKDSAVEEVIGFALWSYWEEGWLPKLDEGLFGEDDPNYTIKISAVGWILRLAEDDGEIDDDFPPPDRSGKITKFSADAYAILEATPAQVQANQVLESKIVRRPSRTASSKKVIQIHPDGANSKLTVPLGAMPTIGSAYALGTSLGSIPLSTSLGPSSSHGPQIFLRIKVAEGSNEVHISTTIPVSAGMYMQEALELVCRKRKIANPNDYALVIQEGVIKLLIPLDRTVASLQGKRELTLMKKAMLPQLGMEITKLTGKTTDPNASIFKRMSDAPENIVSAMLDLSTAYRKYTVYRKLPMLVTRQERMLAIDGAYIHILPTGHRAKVVFDNAKTQPYHVKSLTDCQQSSKSSSVFKLVFKTRKGGTKRYDFEAESSKLAAEIVSNIKRVKTRLDRDEALPSPPSLLFLQNVKKDPLQMTGGLVGLTSRNVRMDMSGGGNGMERSGTGDRSGGGGANGNSAGPVQGAGGARDNQSTHNTTIVATNNTTTTLPLPPPIPTTMSGAHGAHSTQTNPNASHSTLVGGGAPGGAGGGRDAVAVMIPVVPQGQPGVL